MDPTNTTETLDSKKVLITEQLDLMDTYVAHLKYLLSLKIKNRKKLGLMLRERSEIQEELSNSESKLADSPSERRQYLRRLRVLEVRIRSRLRKNLKKRFRKGKTMREQGVALWRQLADSIEELNDSIELKETNNQNLRDIIDILV